MGGSELGGEPGVQRIILLEEDVYEPIRTDGACSVLPEQGLTSASFNGDSEIQSGVNELHALPLLRHLAQLVGAACLVGTRLHEHVQHFVEPLLELHRLQSWTYLNVTEQAHVRPAQRLLRHLRWCPWWFLPRCSSWLCC